MTEKQFTAIILTIAAFAADWKPGFFLLALIAMIISCGLVYRDFRKVEQLADQS